MKTTPFYYPLDRHREIEICLRVREYNGIDSDPGVIVREPTLSEAMEMARHLPERVFQRITTIPDLDYQEVATVAAITGRREEPEPNARLIIVRRADAGHFEEWRVQSNPQWDRETRACSQLLDNRCISFAEFQNSGLIYRMIRYQDRATYGIHDVDRAFLLDPRDAHATWAPEWKEESEPLHP